VLGINPESKKGEKVSFMKKLVELTGHTGAVTGVCFLDPQFVVSSSDDSAIMLWDIERPDRYIVKYNDHQVQVTCIDAFNLDSNIIVSGSADTTVRLWDIRQKSPCIRLFDKNDSSINCVKFMFDQGNTVAVG
jgi:WD40 repeat protein